MASDYLLHTKSMVCAMVKPHMSSTRPLCCLTVPQTAAQDNMPRARCLSWYGLQSAGYIDLAFFAKLAAQYCGEAASSHETLLQGLQQASTRLYLVPKVPA